MGDTSTDALLNGRQCSESIGISYNAFSKWKVPHAESGRGRERLYRLSDVLKVYRERCRRELEKEMRPQIEAELAGREQEADDPFLVKLELDKERVRLTREQADAQELKNEIARHDVAPFAFITFLLGKTSNELAGVMDALPVELMRKLSLTPQEVEKVKGVTALAADSIFSLADEQFIGDSLDEFVAETDQ